MPFCSYSQELANADYTVVENAFITDYLPDAPPKCAEVYLYGLYLCGLSASAENSVSALARTFDMSEEDILTAFTYWEELGLIHILNKKPFEVVYLPVKPDSALLKKIKPGKYAKFNKEIQNVLSGRMISLNEFNEYYLFLETTHFEPEALARVAEYCAELKGNDINYSYILTVARNLNKSGIKTFEKVDEKLNSNDKFNDDLLIVFKALNLKRGIDFEDRRLYEKWTNNYGFTLDVILYVAKQVKKGGTDKLGSKLDSYYRLRLFSQKEISDYEKNCAETTGLAVELNKIMGLYYSSLDYIVESYVQPWLTKGFDKDALKLIAQYCFTHNLRTFEGLSQTVEKFYKLGLVAPDSIYQYVNSIIQEDESIKQILDECGLIRLVSSADRNFYKNWTKNWGFSRDIILYAATLSKNATNPIAYMNKVLSEFKNEAVTNLEQAKKRGNVVRAAEQSGFNNYGQRTYTAEQLNALFDNLDDISD